MLLTSSITLTNRRSPISVVGRGGSLFSQATWSHWQETPLIKADIEGTWMSLSYFNTK